MDAQSKLNEISKQILHNMRRADFIHRILTLPLWMQDMKFVNHLWQYDNKVCSKPFIRFHRIEKISVN